MTDKNQQNQGTNDVDGTVRVRMPATISIRDVFFIVSVVISGIVAFSSLSGRTSVIESQLVEIKSTQRSLIARADKHEENTDKRLEDAFKQFDSRFDLIEKDIERLKLRYQWLSTKESDNKSKKGK